MQASVVYVARQPGGVSAAVPLSALRDFHTRTQSGGRGEATYFPHLYARVSCTDVDNPDFGHSGSHGPCPHEIVVCVESTEREDVWNAICDLAGYHPPTSHDYEREVERVKREILQRFDVDREPPERRQPIPSVDSTNTLWCFAFDAEVERWLYPFVRKRESWSDERWYLDHKDGGVVWL